MLNRNWKCADGGAKGTVSSNANVRNERLEQWTFINPQSLLLGCSLIISCYCDFILTFIKSPAVNAVANIS